MSIEQNEKAKYKIAVLLIPFWGHLNPVAGMVNELVNKYKANVIFYGNKENKTLIESIGASFRQYSYYPTAEYMAQLAKEKNDDIIETLDAIYFNNVTTRILPELVNMIETEKPDLIISEPFAVHVKYLSMYLEKNSIKMPPCINYFTTFPIIPNLYPNVVEEEIGYKQKFSIWRTLRIFYYSIVAYVKQVFFCRRFGIKYTNPFLHLYSTWKADLNLVSIMPELQPRQHMFDKTFKFSGAPLSESIRNKSQLIDCNDSRISYILNSFPSINPLSLEDDYFLANKSSNYKSVLMYASLGTVFNNNFDLMFKIVCAFKLLLADRYNDIGTKNVQVLISCGKTVLEIFEDKIKNERFDLPENIVLCKSAPQIEILKRYREFHGDFIYENIFFKF
jgi:hypothetical protein